MINGIGQYNVFRDDYSKRQRKKPACPSDAVNVSSTPENRHGKN